jgi:hypothetical protein
MFFKVLSIECTILLIKFKNNVDVYIYMAGKMQKEHYKNIKVVYRMHFDRAIKGHLYFVWFIMKFFHHFLLDI